MRLALLAIPLAMSTSVIHAAVPTPPPPRPYVAVALGDEDLAACYGAGTWNHRDTQMSDDFAANLDRQSVLVRTAITDIWSLEVAAPLIITNLAGTRP